MACIFSGSFTGLHKIPESTKQKVGEENKMQQEVVEVLESNAKSKNVTQKQGSQIESMELIPEFFNGGPILPEKPPEKPLSLCLLALNLKTEKRIKQQKAKKVLGDKHFIRSLPLLKSC